MGEIGQHNNKFYNRVISNENKFSQTCKEFVHTICLTWKTLNARVKTTGRLDQRNNFTITNEDKREPPISTLKRATNSQIKTNPQLVQ